METTLSTEDVANRRPALIATTLGSSIVPPMGSSINIALPSIGKEFGLDVVMLNWATTSYLLTATMFLIPLGTIVDIYGRKKVFLYGFLLYTLSSFSPLYRLPLPFQLPPSFFRESGLR